MTAVQERDPDTGQSRWEFTRGFWLRLAALGLFDAGVIALVPILWAADSLTLLVFVLGSATLVNYAYLSARSQALKWLTPGLILMALFVVWPLVYTAYVSLTNWQTGNVLTKSQAIGRLESRPLLTGDSVPLSLWVFRNDDGDLRFLAEDPEGTRYFGEPRFRTDEPLEDPLEDPEELGVVDEDGDGVPESIGGFRRLLLGELIAIANDLERLVLDVPGVGIVQVQTPTTARLIEATQRYIYDPETDTLFDAQRGVTCEAGVGQFVCEGVPLFQIDGAAPGWREAIGFDNYVAIFTNPRIRDPFVKVFTWNVVFALLSVVFTFSLGLLLSNALQVDKLRGKAFYRSIFIIPYAIPAFISTIVWRGLLNDRFGQVNRVLDVIGIDAIPWLRDPFWAKVAVLLVNLWLGFPYMFLITTGALQAIPGELKEAARVDGAGPARVFSTITLPLLLVSTAPLLIGSFAFNFNNFVLIFLLTNGGPPVAGAAVPVGETDILISFTFNIAVQSGRGQQFALASAIVLIIFFIVAAISAFSFRFTKRLEDVYGNV
ncbi:MAG: maltose ABC transporter permease MalF [Acidimicrobiia bacterium]